VTYAKERGVGGFRVSVLIENRSDNVAEDLISHSKLRGVRGISREGILERTGGEDRPLGYAPLRPRRQAEFTYWFDPEVLNGLATDSCQFTVEVELTYKSSREFLLCLLNPGGSGRRHYKRFSVTTWRGLTVKDIFAINE
jgi:hypothetical protein